MSFGIPPATAPLGMSAPPAEAVNAALAALQAMEKLSATKAFTGWFMGLVLARVAELEREILDGELNGDSVMIKRVQRKEVLGFIERLHAAHSAAKGVLAEHQVYQAAKNQLRETGPLMTSLPVMDFSGNGTIGQTPPDKITVAGLMEEADQMFSVWGQPAETNTTTATP